MLVLSRREGERIMVGRDIVITVVECRGNQVRLGVTAPRGIAIHRQEVSERLARQVTGDSLYDGYGDGSPFFSVKRLSMREYDCPSDRNPNGRTAEIFEPTCEPAESNHDDQLGEWQSRISMNRPVYVCPACCKNAMQFYSTHALHSDRADFFICQACGITWNI